MKTKLKVLPIGIQSFELLRSSDYLYVDKTKQVYDLSKNFGRYFLSRPRRFGKSLLCSTFKALFEGKKELFRDLWIDGPEANWEWKKYPVIHLSFGSIDHATPEELKQSLHEKFEMIAEEYGISLTHLKNLRSKFSYLIKQCAKKNRVALIIDEYDKPILDHLINKDVAREMRNILRSFYGTFKDLDEHLRFVFITGVTKFSKTSVFSGMNNLEDLSFTNQAATLCGYTQQELVKNFDQHLELSAQKQKTTKEEIIKKMKHWYDGYRFHEEITDKEYIYNPFSVLLSLKHKNFKNYWFGTGTPTFLMDVIKEKNYPVTKIENVKLNETELDAFDIDDTNLFTLLLQTGYLTIVDYIPTQQNYVLSYPNYEVKISFSRHIIKAMTSMPMAEFSDFVDTFRIALEKSDLEGFCQKFHDFLKLVPCTLRMPYEKYYHSLFFIVVRLFISDVIVEDSTEIGFIDSVIQTKTHIFIIEFKYKGTPEKALKQIEEKKYAEKYTLQHPDKTIMRAGIVFDVKNKKFEMSWKVQDH